LSVGLLWLISNRWKLGAVYREGPEFDFVARSEAGPQHASLAPGTVLAIELPNWQFPSILGLGGSFRSRNDHWVFSFEWDRVRYSSILKAFASLPGNDDDALPNANEFHAGVEYAFLTTMPIVSLRLGAWHDPDHRIRSVSPEPFSRAELPRGEDEPHFAAGLGVAFSRFQLDLGVDLSQRRDTASLSVVYSF